MTAATHLALSPDPQPEPSYGASMVLTFLPLVLLVIFFFVFLRFLRRANRRAEEAMRLTREMVAELRAIRAALAPEGGTKAAEPKPPERENTLSGQTIPSR
jgi:hypothetical protein